MRKMAPILCMPLVLAGCFETSSSDSDESVSLGISAGDDLVAEERASVALSATLKSDEPVGEIEWSQVSGAMVDLIDADTLNPKFKAPESHRDQELVFRITAMLNDRRVSDDIRVFIKDRRASSQGINEDIGDRRSRGISKRSGNRPMHDSREVRTYDGTNNNLEQPLWGAAFTHLDRWGEASYSDGISSLAGEHRPSARVVSNNMSSQDADLSIPNTFGTSDLLWQWGQFIDHDIGITDGAEESADISVPSGDPHFDPTGTGDRTILFSRALFDHETGTEIGNPREQENEITAWIDGSMIYGSDDDRALALRVNENSPYLATSEGNLLPFNTSGQTNANAFGVDDADLFLAGDVRANEQVGLAVMHTLWVREHNRLASILESKHPSLTGEEVFQATRRLVIAKLQIITYDEYLPALIGDNALSKYRGYDSSVNPGMFNEFAVAAYRYGHSLVSETLQRLDSAGNSVEEGPLSLRDAFFTAPNLLQEESDLDPILRGMAKQLSQKLDTKVNNVLRNFLFGQPGAGGFDLVSLNIQRGRDHGVPSYNDMRETMGFDRVDNFSEVSSDPEIVAALAQTYASVDDIDLWVGGLSEDALVDEGSQLGELFREMHIRQFEAFRDGDRFWYQRDLRSSELDLVKGSTLSQVIKDNTSIGDELQDSAFYVE